VASIRRVSSAGLTAAEIASIRAMLIDAFEPMAAAEGAFEDDDWDHALGGTHVVLEQDGQILAHAAVVERPLEIDGRPVRTGYVEAVGTRLGHHGRGHGSAVMREVNDIILADPFELGALGTGRFRFYARLGWERWRGASFVRTPHGLEATPDDDGYLMVLRTPSTPPLDVHGSISCDWRPGDVW
jgi:aminoglycoside 2'-N-acetyltransferase I